MWNISQRWLRSTPSCLTRIIIWSSTPGAEKTYELLRRSLLAKKEVAVAKTVIGTNENLIVIYPTKDCLIAKVLFYQEEIQEMPISPAKVEVTKQELDMAKTLIESMTQTFDISAYHDEY